MALQNFRPVSIIRQNSCAYSRGMYLHKNRNYKISNKRSLASKPVEKKEPDPCDYKICNKKPKKKSFWRRIFGAQEEKPLPPVECCRVRQKDRCDPDLSEFGGQPYRTCGSAYIIQKDILPVDEHETTKEERILKMIEASPEYKDIINEEPLPKFKNAASRILEMSDMKLHPEYKKYSGIKKKYFDEQKRNIYKTVSWPIDMHEIPARLNINKEIFDKKNMEYMEFKRVDPPRQLIHRIIEMDRNAKPTLQAKKNVPVDMNEVEKRQQLKSCKGAVFDTLYQTDTKF